MKPLTFELKEGQVALVISHADYHALMRVLRTAAHGNTEAERLVPILKVEGLEEENAQ